LSERKNKKNGGNCLEKHGGKNGPENLNNISPQIKMNMSGDKS